ncbi:MAG TPA: iron ABC transporter permease [Nakamurella multipartita]|nr:iron ABC transporter permease [Nakamurella multipartita]
MRTAVGRRPPWPLVTAAGLITLITLVPVLYLGERAVDRGWAFVIDELVQARTAALVGRSLALVGVVTAACGLLGTALAVLVTRTDLPGRRHWSVLLALPLAVPSYVAAYIWISEFPGLAGFWGAAIVLTIVSYPYVFLPAVAALSRLDPAQEEVARSLGRSGAAVLFGVTLRRARAAIAAGCLLVALYVLSDFGAVATMRYEAFTWVIYGAYRAGFNPSRAAILAMVLLFFAVLLIIAEALARGRASAYRVGAGVARPAPLIRLGRAGRGVAFATVGVVLAAGLLFPLGTLLLWVSRSVQASIDLAELAAALSASIGYSLAAAAVTLAMAVPVALLAARYRGPAVSAIERTTFLTHALPGIVVAVAGVYLGARVLRPLYQSSPMLVLAYVVLFLPLAVGSIRAAVESSPARLEEVAVSLGRSSPRAFFAVTAPLAASGMAAGAALVFLATMKELPATLLLHPTGTQTLATGLWQYTTVSDYGRAAPYAAALVLFAAVPTAILGRWSGRAGEIRGH